jgi:hypothetical protein
MGFTVRGMAVMLRVLSLRTVAASLESIRDEAERRSR